MHKQLRDIRPPSFGHHTDAYQTFLKDAVDMVDLAMNETDNFNLH